MAILIKIMAWLVKSMSTLPKIVVNKVLLIKNDFFN